MWKNIMNTIAKFFNNENPTNVKNSKKCRKSLKMLGNVRKCEEII
jgi:hypothetical protein